MPVFTYTALDRSGRQLSGSIPADNRSAALDGVIGQGLSPITLDEQGNGRAHVKKEVVSTSTRVPQTAVENFTRELANLLAAGLPLSRALHLLRREASQPGARNVWNAVHDDVVGGTALADALAKWPKAFSSVYVAMVRAGEQGGFLHVVLQQIADFRTREADLKGKVKAAMIYPIVLGLLAAGVLTFLMTFFIPRFSAMFKDFGGNLPVLTQVIVSISQFVTSKWGFLILAAAIAAVFGVRHASGTEAGKRLIERTLLKTPAVGHVMARFALVRFCRMLGTLVSSGVPLVNALRTAREAIGNQTLADAVGYAIDEVQRGTALSKALSASPILFPASVVEMVSIAEETGRLDKELLRLSLAYEGDLDRSLRMLVALAEPALLFIMAGLIGTVVVGMLLPVFNLQDLVK